MPPSPLLHTIVVGGLNTDILGIGVERIVGRGELSYGGKLQISPGGKSRNMAQMVAALSEAGAVAMIGRTAMDAYGLWKAPVEALQAAGVVTDYVRILSAEEAQGKMPGIALIPVDSEGKNQIYVLPGVNEDFSVSDLEAATDAFEVVATHGGTLLLSLECPLPTAVAAVTMGNAHGIRVLLDPGGMSPGQSYDVLLEQRPFLLKPNTHEASLLSGQSVSDFSSAGEAAAILRGRGARHVLVTDGAKGAYLFAEDGSAGLHLPAPTLPETGVRDETGCGDQTMAALAAALAKHDVAEACRRALVAGTLQFHRSGVAPITKAEWAATLAWL